MSLTFTILGCGSSAGVPRVGLGWGACNPDNPKNRRRRCSILVQRQGGGGATNVVVDTSPDLRMQLLDAGVNALDGVLFTHDHADHTHGIDDLRPIAIYLRRRIDVFADAPTSHILREKFGYCFETPPGSDYPPILNEHRIEMGRIVEVNGKGGVIAAMPIAHQHGLSPSLGFRFGDIAYSPDVSDMPDASTDALKNLDLWIVDALRYTPHPSHFSVDDALRWIERLKPKRAILTNLHSDLDYDELSSRMPANVIPAYDGLRIVVD